jgi:hypothetical protein
VGWVSPKSVDFTVEIAFDVPEAVEPSPDMCVNRETDCGLRSKAFDGKIDGSTDNLSRDLVHGFLVLMIGSRALFQAQAECKAIG